MAPLAAVPIDRFTGCLLGQAVGDALGAPYEGLPADHVFYVHGPVAELLDADDSETLLYTDDTQMMIGLAEALLEVGPLTPANLAALMRRFAANYDPERGYGAGARQVLEAAAAGGDWDALAESLLPGGSFGNGAAMRVAPVGLLFADDLNLVAEQARLSALPTHRHALGIEGARLFALAVALAATAGPPLDRDWFYEQLLQRCGQDEFAWQLRAARKLRARHDFGFLGNSLPAHRSVVTAIACFTACPRSYEQAVTRAIALGDDTDTLAAMAGALSGAHLGRAAVPERWLGRLEAGPRGGEYIEGLAARLHGRYEAGRVAAGG